MRSDETVGGILWLAVCVVVGFLIYHGIALPVATLVGIDEHGLVALYVLRPVCVIVGVLAVLGVGLLVPGLGVVRFRRRAWRAPTQDRQRRR